MEGMRMEYYFDPDDRLERKKYAEFLKSMLENCDKYRREDSDGAYVIAIDSPWGTGKTRFAKMLRNYLEGREPKIVSEKVDQSFIPPAKEDRKFNVIYYNSWETDYWTDAIEPLMDSILNSEAFKQFRQDKRNKEAWKSLLRFAKGVLKASGYALASKVFGETAVGIFKTGLSELKRKPINPLARFKNKETHYMGFRKALEQVIAKTGKPLVIIVDELDRCRPTYAIQTLELVKHLFAVKGSFFIFALDVEQLSCAVRTIYGSNDAPGYLCRFFDYVGKMPDPNRTEFIRICLEHHKGFSTSTTEWKGKTIEYFHALSKSFTLSLRDITTIIKSYQLMLDTFLFEYKYIQFHRLYVFLMTLKYKEISLYSNFMLHKRNENREGNSENSLIKVKKYLPELSKIEKSVLEEQLQLLNNTIALSTLELREYSSFIERLNRKEYTVYYAVETAKLETDKKDSSRLAIYPRFKNELDGGTHPGNPKYFDDTNVLSDVIEFNDLLKWDDIKSKSLAQYYYQQLEMFNFALPADEPETKA